MKRFEIEFGKWVVKFRWWIIVSTILLFFAAAHGLGNITFNNDTRVFFSDENPQLKALEELENTYNKFTNILFTIAPQNGDVFNNETLSAIEELTEEAWQIPYSSRVNSITNFQHTRVEEDDLIVEDLVLDAMSLSDEEIAEIKSIALSNHQLVNNYVSPSGHVSGINVTVLLPGESMEEVPEAALFARQLADNMRGKFPGTDFYLSGSIMSDQAFGEVGQNDMSSVIPLMFLTLLILIGLSLRSFTGLIGTLLVILMSMFTGLGIAGWLGISLTSASVNAPTIILTLAIAASVHIIVTMHQQMRSGKLKHEAIAESLRTNLQPVLLTSITTAIGFLTMNFSDAPPFRDLGNIVSIGVIGSIFYSVLFLPALMAVLPVMVKSIKNTPSKNSLDSLANFVINNRKFILIGTVIFIGLMTLGISQIKLHDKFVKYFSEDYDIRIASDFVEENLSGGDVIEYSLKAVEPGGINDPGYLLKVDEFADWYRQQPNVVHVSAITNTVKRLNKNMHGDDVLYYRIPETRELAAQYLLLYEMSLPFGLDLNDQINVDKSATRMIILLKNVNTTELRNIEEDAQEWMSVNLPENMYTHGSGLSIIWAHLSGRNINSMLIAAVTALVLISILLIFALRSVKLGILSLLPNLAPAFMAFGLWGLIVGQVGLGLSIVASMTLGIVVDDTIHFMSKYLRARREHDMNSSNAVRYSFQTVGKAMWITTLVLVVGFSVLTLSGYKMNSDMGLLSAITILLALILDFLFLPVLLMLVNGKSKVYKNI